MMKILMINVFCLILYSWACSQSPAKFISFNDKHISYVGRIGATDSCKEIYWTGTYLTLKIKGSNFVNALLADTRENNYFYIIIDGEEQAAKKIRIDKAKNYTGSQLSKMTNRTRCNYLKSPIPTITLQDFMDSKLIKELSY